MLLVAPPVDAFFIERFFGWMPAQFFDTGLMESLSGYSRGTLLLTGVLFTISVTAGALVEELYFRGYLLPHMPDRGIWTPLLNTLLFSLYHFWSPWQNVARILAIFPYIYLTWRKRSLAIAITVHCTLNLISGIALTVSLLNAV
jgi:membrane protease YdiL (CAAX protease family)